jgi:hypothetical protein
VLELADFIDVPRRRLDRMSALATLDDAVVPADADLDAATWPIGAAMLQFPSVAPGGASVREAGPEYWRRQFRRMQREGFDVVEIPSAWLPIAEMTVRERGDLVDVLADLGIAVCATSMVRMSVVDPDADRALENVAATHRGIDAAAEIGRPTHRTSSSHSR